MKKTKIALTTILLVFGCFWLSPAIQAGDTSPIAGFWHVHYISDFAGPVAESYQQWHGDGLEWESPNFTTGQCSGIFTPTGTRSVRLFHVGWIPGGGPNGSVRFVLREPDTVVSLDGNSFEGRYDQKFFDADGNLVFEDMGRVRAARITVN